MKRRSSLKSAAAFAAAPAFSPLAEPRCRLPARRRFAQPAPLSAELHLGHGHRRYQVEGAVHEDGRGASVWDTFSHTPGKTFQGQTGDVADDFYHRYKKMSR